MSQPRTRAGRTLAAMPKSICQTSPRLAFAIPCLPSIQRSCSLGSNGHHFLVAPALIELRVQPADERQLLARRQLANGLLDFGHRTHGHRVIGILISGKSAAL